MPKKSSESARQAARAGTRQRSFRWSRQVLDSLEQRARELGDNANSVAERLVFEGLRTDRHPLIHFCPDPRGRRGPALVGTRLYVGQVVQTIRDSDNSLVDAAEYLGLNRAQIQAAADYYAEYRDEVDADAQDTREFEERERERWERSQQAFA